VDVGIFLNFGTENKYNILNFEAKFMAEFELKLE
jgi:hypothetical protein